MRAAVLRAAGLLPMAGSLPVNYAAFAPCSSCLVHSRGPGRQMSVQAWGSRHCEKVAQYEVSGGEQRSGRAVWRPGGGSASRSKSRVNMGWGGVPALWPEVPLAPLLRQRERLLQDG